MAMQANRTILRVAAVMIFCLCFAPNAAQPSESNLTPPPDSPLRKTVLDALRRGR